MEVAHFYQHPHQDESNPYATGAPFDPQSDFLPYPPHDTDFPTNNFFPDFDFNTQFGPFAGFPQQYSDDIEDVEKGRPRLTQEQINILEDNFKEVSKPGTEFKKRLAERIGLSPNRVNVRRELPLINL